MPGFDLREGWSKQETVSEDELWSAFTSLFSSQVVMVSSCKYGFLKAILDNLYNVDEDLNCPLINCFRNLLKYTGI